MVKTRTLVMIAMLATVASPAFAQVNYDHIRRVQGFMEKLAGGDLENTWSIHDEEDSFTRETRRYVMGFGERGILFIVANCESIAVLFRDDGLLFDAGKIESIWDDGNIVEHEFDDRDSILASNGTDWLRLLTGHDSLRVRVRAYPASVASDEFDLQAIRWPPALRPMEGDITASNVDHVRLLFSEIGCALE
jgi:hypothetical protein